MVSYLVRGIDSHQLVGLFVAEDLDALHWLIDGSVCDPGECEFVELPPGGIYFDGEESPEIPKHIPDPEDEDAFPDWFSGANLMEHWLDLFVMHEANDGRWQPVVEDESDEAPPVAG